MLFTFGKLRSPQRKWDVYKSEQTPPLRAPQYAWRMPARCFLELRHGISVGTYLTTKQLKRIYVEGLRLLHSAESQLNNTLPQMARVPSTEELRAWLTGRPEQAKEYVASLERLCAAIQERPQREKCTHTEFLLVEGMRIMRKSGAPERLDMELVAIAHGIEVQEIAGLGCVCSRARLLKEDAVSSVLEEMLEERKVAARGLARLSDAMETKATGLIEWMDPAACGGRRQLCVPG
jgi:ferritin-like metal-binding protein YciE